MVVITKAEGIGYSYLSSRKENNPILKSSNLWVVTSHGHQKAMGHPRGRALLLFNVVLHDVGAESCRYHFALTPPEYDGGWSIPGPIFGRPGADQASSSPGALHDLNGGRTRFLVPVGPRSQRVLSGDPT